MSFLVCLCLLAVLSVSVSATDGELNFLMLGDWGGIPNYPYHTPQQVAAAKGMSTFTPEFVLALGDNFYYQGVENDDSPRFDQTWGGVYVKKYSSLQVPWYVIAGNHDHYGNASAQVA